MKNKLREYKEKVRIDDLIILSAGLILSILIRYQLFNFESVDYIYHIKKWYLILERRGFTALSSDFYNYNPPFLYLLFIATLLFKNIQRIVAVKLVSVVFDYICAFLVFKLIRLKYQDGPLPIIAFFATLFLPTVLLNSSMWGQSDIIFTSFLVMCVYYLVLKKDTLAFVSFGIALSFKLQALFLAPLVFTLIILRYISWKKIWIAPAVYILFLVPAWVAGRPLLDLLLIYWAQARTYYSLSLSAPSVFAWFPNEYYSYLMRPGLIWGAVVIFFYVSSIYKSKISLSPQNIIQLSLLSTLMMPLFLPKMHDRYFFPADILSVAFAFYFPQASWIAIVIVMSSFFAYMPFLFEAEFIPIPIIALALLIAFIGLVRHIRITNMDGLASRDS